MSMSLRMLAERLSSSECDCFYEITDSYSSDNISNVEILDNHKPPDPNCIYIVQSEHIGDILIKKGDGPKNILILAKDRKLYQIYSGELRQNRIVIIGGKSPAWVNSKVQEIILAYSRWASKLYICAIENLGLQRLLDVAYEYFNNPIMVLDNSFKVLAYSKKDGFNGKTWVDTCNAGYISPAEDFKAYIALLSKSNNSFSFSSEYLPYRLFAKIVTVNAVNVGIIHIVERFGKVTKGQQDALTLLSSLVAFELGKNDSLKSAGGAPYASLIIDLIENNIKKPDIPGLSGRMKHMDWFIKGCFSVMVLKPRDQYVTSGQLSEIMAQMSGLVAEAKGAVYERAIVFIVNNETGIVITEGNRSSLQSFLELYQLNCGISRSTTQLTDVHHLYRQAVKAIDIGGHVNADAHLYFYQDYILYDSLLECTQNSDMALLCMDRLVKLADYDEQHGAELMKTLKAYINNKYNQLKTSKLLHVNRGTLIYRLNRIEKLMGVDLNDNTVLLHIHLSFFIMAYNPEAFQKLKERALKGGDVMSK